MILWVFGAEPELGFVIEAGVLALEAEGCGDEVSFLVDVAVHALKWKADKYFIILVVGVFFQKVYHVFGPSEAFGCGSIHLCFVEAEGFEPFVVFGFAFDVVFVVVDELVVDASEVTVSEAFGLSLDGGTVGIGVFFVLVFADAVGKVFVACKRHL